MKQKQIEELREFFSLGCEYSGSKEVVNDTVANILENMGSQLTCVDEIGLTDGENEFSNLKEFVEQFWNEAVELFLNVLSTQEVEEDAE